MRDLRLEYLTKVRELVDGEFVNALALSPQGLTVPDLAERLGRSRQNIERHLVRLIGDEIVVVELVRTKHKRGAPQRLVKLAPAKASQ